jgi:hypothetical protein
MTFRDSDVSFDTKKILQFCAIAVLALEILMLAEFG